MAANDKDTIYIDIDDEITGIIDKLRGSSGKVVALVLPKRAAVFQSIVNMKLLKRAADTNKKHLVLITSEAGLLPLAGMAGVHVAKTLTSKPEIPLAPLAVDDHEETVQEDGTNAETPLSPDQTVGQLAGPAAAGVAAGVAADGVETLVLDDEATPPEAEVPAVAAAKSFEPPKAKKNKKLAIPNFERFRLLLALGVLLLLVLIGGLIFAMTALPKATISIKTDATSIDANVPFNLSTTANSLKPTTNTVPAKLASQPKTYTQQVPTTGQKNNGNKASGSITMSAVECGVAQPDDVPQGTGVSGNSLTYITQQNTTFVFSKIKDGCIYFNATSQTQIIAQSGGANFNGATTFTVAGRKDVTAQAASPVSGGTDSIVQIVNQNDITSAKSKITANDGEMKTALTDQLRKDNYFPIAATYSAGTPAVVSSANVGDIATTVTVTETITPTMFGVRKDDLRTLLQNNIKGQIDTAKQSILNDGLDTAVFSVDNVTATDGKLAMNTKAVVGPELNIDNIRQQAVGKKPGEIKAQFQNNPDVTGVDVKLSPFWVSSVPKKTSRITVDIAKPTPNAKASSSGSQP